MKWEDNSLLVLKIQTAYSVTLEKNCFPSEQVKNYGFVFTGQFIQNL